MNTDNQATVKFSKEFITPSGLKEWVGIEWPVGVEVDRDAIFSTLDKVRDAVLDWHQRNNTLPTHLDTGFGMLPVQWNKAEPVESRIEALVQDIQRETVLRLPDGTGGLDAWKLLADRQPALKEAYDTRRKQIIDGEIKGIMEKTEALRHPKSSDK